MNNVEAILGELGISQYTGIFLDQGFDTWDTILDITESDLDALGVKLGHRRKLQRRIANHRGLTTVVSLASPARTSIEDASTNAIKVQHSEVKDGISSTKRKYRRHPKPDPNAPERPPSAYVLFSNKTRDGLKGQNLTFTEIAKLVGENWQNLDRSEKEPYESQAQEAKDKYNHDMNDYKKTAEYKKYSDYLQDFRKRQATQDKDASKRIKTDSDREHRASSTGATSSGAKSNAGSGSDSQPGSEPPPTQQQRLSPVTSSVDVRIAPMIPLNTSQHSPNEKPLSGSPRSLAHETIFNRVRGYSNPTTQDSSEHGRHRFSGPMEGLRERQLSDGASSFNLAPMANPLEPRFVAAPISDSPEPGVPSLAPNHSHTGSSGRGSASSRFWSRPPSLRTELSSTGSISSHGSYLPRTPSESSLPIHALLSSKPTTPAPPLVAPAVLDNIMTNSSISTPYPGRGAGDKGIDGWSLYTNCTARADILSTGGSEPPHPGSYFPSLTTKPPPSASITAAPLGILHEQATPVVSNPNRTTNPNLDGMNALLQASDLVDRQAPGN